MKKKLSRKDNQHIYGYIHGIEDFLNCLCNDAYFFFGKENNTMIPLSDLQETANAIIEFKIKTANELIRIKEVGKFIVKRSPHCRNRPNPYFITFVYNHE
jgi:hypothetical protein